MNGNWKAARPGTYKLSIYRLMGYLVFMLYCVLLCERKLCREWKRKHLHYCHRLLVQEATCSDCAVSSAVSILFEVASSPPKHTPPPTGCSYKIEYN